MILDSFTLDTLTLQLNYPDAFEIWDSAGAISRKLSEIWPGIGLVDAKPHEQILRGEAVTIETGINRSLATLSLVGSFDQRVTSQLSKCFDIWKLYLEISNFQRISTRARYQKLFPSIKEANDWILSLNLVKRPSEKVFDQPTETEKNSVSVSYRFEDSTSFSLVDIKSEQISYELKLDKNYVDEPDIKGLRNRVIIDFDRGVLGEINAEKFRMEDWLKGFQHLLRRDIDKVLGERK